MKRVLTVLCVLFTLFQGGFFDTVWALCGIAAITFLMFRMTKLPSLTVMICIGALLFVYTGSIIYHGLSYEALASLTKLTVACLLLIVFCDVETDVAETLFIAGIAVAVIGCLAFLGILPLEGNVTTRRLQGVFQYANATGIFLAAAAFMTRLNSKRRRYAVIMEAALLLTQSVGAILVYIIGWVVYLLKNKSTYPKIFRRKWIIWTGSGLVFITAMVVLLLVRGYNPFTTYLDRLVQISDGLGLMTRHPLGIGPGVWQFHSQSYQSARYLVTKIHSEYIAIGANAGLFALIPLLVFLIYWLRRQEWDGKTICAGMILLHAVLDIPFSFLPIVFVLAMLFAETLPKPVLKTPAVCRIFLLLPLALCVFILISSAVKNQAAWSVQGGDPARAAIMLDNRLMRNDTDAILTRMALYIDMGRHDELDRAFSELRRPNAEAYARMTQSYIQRERYPEAAAHALACIEASPHSPRGYALLEYSILHLEPVLQEDYRMKMAKLREQSVEHPLFTYIYKLMGDQELSGTP